MFVDTEIEKSERKSELILSDKYQILVVDDNQDILDVLKDVLTFHGYKVSIAIDVEEAVEVFNSVTPDLILCDILLPNKDGYEFFEFVRQEKSLVQIPFIFLSALNSPEHIKMGKEKGCDDYLTKPFDLEELLSVIKGKLRTAELRKQKTESNVSDHKKKIIQILSHEFRTPLVSLTSGTELLKDMHHELTKEEVIKLLTTIQKDGFRLERLVNDFMLMQQIEAGQAAKTFETFAKRHKGVLLLQDAIESFEEVYSMSQNVNHFELTFACKDSLAAEIIVYDVHFKKIVQHILSNALRFTDLSLGIRINVELKKDYFVIQVRDFGPGIEAQLKEKVCEPFNQINREYFEQQGVGLGLSIVKRLTELNNGRFSFIEPPDNLGVIVEIKFPMEDK